MKNLKELKDVNIKTVRIDHQTWVRMKNICTEKHMTMKDLIVLGLDKIESEK